ncbi:MAG: murein L,D-transpeptidase family protein, partial [Acidobacteriota bacterium]
MKRFGHVLVLACLLLLPARQAAGEWTADVVDTEWFPGRSVAVDKRAQSFFLLTRQSPLRVADFIPCATGQLLGDKSKEGDLRTPEGVYFITRRKAGGLNYELYGDLAFPLNFPNPADVVRKKTGHGIWIHGRGHAIIPYETQGCVAVNTPDLHRLDTELALGTPVIIADELRLDADARQIRSEAREVVEATKNWAKAWQDRSDAFFDFHDPEKFAITEGQAFATFRSQKERLFKSLPWIQVTLSDLRALPGPDYWVTFFVQLYRSPTLISQGIKRLYWQRGTDGRFRIIGMEYEEMPVTVADRGTAKPAALANEAETATARTDAPSEEETQARQLVDAHQAAMEKMAHKAFHALPITRQPTPEDQAILEVAETGPAKPGVSPFASDALRVAAEPPQLPPVPGPKPAAVP